MRWFSRAACRLGYRGLPADHFAGSARPHGVRIAGVLRSDARRVLREEVAWAATGVVWVSDGAGRWSGRVHLAAAAGQSTHESTQPGAGPGTRLAFDSATG